MDSQQQSIYKLSEQGINYFTWNCEHPIIPLKIPFFDVSIATLIDIQVNIHTFDII